MAEHRDDPLRALVPRLRPYAWSVFGETSARAARLGAINLGQGFPDTDGPDALKDVAVAAIRDGSGNQYPPANGILDLREAGAEHQQRWYGLRYDPATEVMVGTGASEVIAAAILGLVDAGDEVIALEPAFDIYAPQVAMAGGRLVTVPLDSAFRPDAAAVETAVTARTRVLLLNTPHNPTGTVLRREELAALAEVALRHDLAVISDEVYEHLVYDDAVHVPMAVVHGMRERTLTVGSGGKSFSFTGWKVGWCTGPAHLVAAPQVARQHVSGAVPAGDRPACDCPRTTSPGWPPAGRAARPAARRAQGSGRPLAPAGTSFAVTDVRPWGTRTARRGRAARARGQILGVLHPPRPPMPTCAGPSPSVPRCSRRPSGGSSAPCAERTGRRAPSSGRRRAGGGADAGTLLRSSERFFGTPFHSAGDTHGRSPRRPQGRQARRCGGPVRAAPGRGRHRHGRHRERGRRRGRGGPRPALGPRRACGLTWTAPFHGHQPAQHDRVLLARAHPIMIFTFVPAAGGAARRDHRVPKGRPGAVVGVAGLVARSSWLTVGLAGAWSDRLGRRPIVVMGYALMGVGIAITPFVGSVLPFYAARGLAAVGIAMITVMITAVVTDYVRNETRGKANGILGLCNGVGAVLTFFVLLRIPDALQNSGMEQTQALRATYLLVAGISLATALFLRFTLRGGRVVEHTEHIPLTTLLRDGIAAGRRPGVAFSYVGAFVARADLALAGAFLTLWAQQYGVNELGLTETDALKKAGILLGVSNGMALIGAPVTGIIADRLSRVDAVLISLGLTSVGYISTLLIVNPFSGVGYAVAALIGFGQVSAVIATQVLVAEQAPVRTRGSVIGTFALSGGIGIMVAFAVGGVLYDAWRPAAPFVLFGLLAAVAMVIGIVLRPRIPRVAHASMDHLADVAHP
jgi:N-succinyldiaminopimelate aminotransferase